MERVESNPIKLSELAFLLHPKDPQDIRESLTNTLSLVQYSIRRGDRLKLTHMLKIVLNIEQKAKAILGLIQSQLDQDSSGFLIYTINKSEFPRKHSSLKLPNKKSILFMVYKEGVPLTGYGYLNHKYLSLVWIENNFLEDFSA